MNAVHQRRRWNTRSGATTTSDSSRNQSSLITTNDNCNSTCYQNCLPSDNRVIYETPDVRLRPLAFYDLVDEIIRPAGLISDGVVGRLNESRVEFTLSIDQADKVAMSTDSLQLLLRFCHLEKSVEQDDNFPPDATVYVNGASLTLPPAISNPNKPNLPPKRVGQHMNITPLCKLCPFVKNEITVKWFVDPTAPLRSYVINVTLAKKVEINALLQRIKDRGMTNQEETKKLIVDSDNEVATTNLQSSLNCPLGKMRMSMPCKSTSCQHIPCFDALVYLQMNERKASWICPVCYKPAYYNDLRLDGFFMDILEKTDSSVTEVTLNLDGSWSPVMKSEQQVSANSAQHEIITISDDDDS